MKQMKWVTLKCPNCGKTQKARKEEIELSARLERRPCPVGTEIIEMSCSDCFGPGDREQVRYYDAKGRWWDGEKFRYIRAQT